MKPSPLKRIRSAYGLRVVDIASAAGVSIDTVRRIDRLDVATLQLDSLVKVARALGLAPTNLVPGLTRRPTSRVARGESGRSHGSVIEDILRRC